MMYHVLQPGRRSHNFLAALYLNLRLSSLVSQGRVTHVNMTHLAFARLNSPPPQAMPAPIAIVAVVYPSVGEQAQAYCFPLKP